MTPFKLTDAQLDAAFADGLSACIGAPVRLTPPEPSPDVVCSCHAKREADEEAPYQSALRPWLPQPEPCNVCPVIALEQARFNAAFGAKGVATCPKCGACPPSSNQERK